MLVGEILFRGADFEVEALLPGFRASPVGYVVFAAYAGITPNLRREPNDGNLNLIRINFFTLPIIVILLLMWVFKIVATALTVGSGAAREVFAPSLVIRGFLGAAFWVVVNQFFPGAMLAPPRDCGDDGPLRRRGHGANLGDTRGWAR